MRDRAHRHWRANLYTGEQRLSVSTPSTGREGLLYSPTIFENYHANAIYQGQLQRSIAEKVTNSLATAAERRSKLTVMF